MNEQNQDTAFSEQQFDSVFPLNINKHYWNRARNFIIWQYYTQYQLAQPCIEIGCGRGSVISYFKDKQIYISGIDVANTKAYDEVADRIITNADALTQSDEYAHQFKSLMLLDVIEHIEDPVAFLKAIFTKYPNVKRVLITVPARMEIWSNFDVYLKHFRRYDLAMMAETAEAVDCKVIASQYAFHSLYPMARLLQKANKDRSTSLVPPKGFIANLAHKMVATYLKVEYNIFPKKWKGTSVIAVLERK